MGLFTRIKIYYKTIQQSKFLNSEHGRSMTEMLGVLAIIGVLSIGAIGGYRYGMNKLRANELINEINMRRVALYQQLIKDPDNLDMEMGDTTKHGYKISSALDAIEEDVFYISVDTIPVGVCKEILRQHWRAPLDIYIDDELVENGQTTGCGSEEVLDMAFKFDKFGKDAEGTSGEPDTPNDTDADTPETTTEPPVDDGCSASSPLKALYPNGCFPCSYQDGLIAQNCTAICPNRIMNKSGYCIMPACPAGKVHDCYGNCHSCDEPAPWDVCFEEYECETVCGRYYDSSNGGKCYLNRETPATTPYESTSPVTSTTTPDMTTTTGYETTTTEDYCLDKPLKDYYDSCYACDSEGVVYVGDKKQNCAVCPNRILSTKDNSLCILKTCPANKPLIDFQGACYSCDATQSVNVNGVPQNCSVCNNRYVNANNYCVPNFCPKDEPLMSFNGHCYPCNSPQTVTVSNTSDCNICPERKLLGNVCALPCPENKPLMDARGTCHSCEEAGGVDVTKVTEHCAICKNRQLNGNYCALPCPKDKPLMDSHGSCYACEYTGIIDVLNVTQNCAVCDNRVLNDRYCILKQCPKNKPVRDRLGYCQSCDYSYAIDVAGVTQNCAVCDNRKLDGNYCVLK